MEDNRQPIDASKCPDFETASGLCVCEECGKLYFDHPMAEEHLSWQGLPWLNRLCDGTLVKL